jgi:hypothetical protein
MAEDDPFRPAKLLVTLASAELDQFQARCDAFIKECKLEFVTDDKSHPTQIVGKVRILGAIPDVLERDAMRFVNELRSSLDKAVNAAAKLLGSTDLKHTHFPFGESETQFQSQMGAARGSWRGIPQEIRNYLLALKPFWGGNDLLRAFGGFSNPTKHENILTVNITFGGIGINPGPGGVLSAHFDTVGTVWNEAKTECEIFRARKNFPANFTVRPIPTIAFNEAQGLTRKEFVPTIRQIAGIVNGIVLGLEAETARILRSRT